MNKIYLISFLSLYILLSSCSDSPPTGQWEPSMDYNLNIRFKNRDQNPGPFPFEIFSAKALIRDIKVVHGSIEKKVYDGVLAHNFYLDGTTRYLTGATIDSGTYSVLRFTLCKPTAEETPYDPAFKEGTEDDKRYSMLIDGKYEGEEFHIKYHDELTVSVTFAAQVRVPATGKVNITMEFNKNKWLGGPYYYDPRLPENYQLIGPALLSSFLWVFQDDN